MAVPASLMLPPPSSIMADMVATIGQRLLRRPRGMVTTIITVATTTDGSWPEQQP